MIEFYTLKRCHEVMLILFKELSIFSFLICVIYILLEILLMLCEYYLKKKEKILIF